MKKENKKRELTIFESALKNYIKNESDAYYLSSDTINYYTLFHFLFTDAILCNNIMDIDYELLYNEELGSGTREDEDGELEYVEFYQYFIVDIDAWRFDKYKEYLEQTKAESDFIVFYSEKLENYVVGITHFGTSWTCVPTGVKIARSGNNENE